MKKGTFWLDYRKEGKVTLGIEDSDVEFFGGADYEMLYTMDTENVEKLRTVLSRTHRGPLEKMIKEEFGIHLDKVQMSKWLSDHGIEFEFFNWVSFDD